ncbi:MAG: hypothetical protein ACRDMU_07650 [Gaiellaceae bacterium]
MTERILPRLGAASGALFVVLLFGLSTIGSDSPIVVALELIALLLFIPFLGFLWSVLREAEGPAGWLSATALGAGLVGVTMKLASVAPGWAARDFGDETAIHKALERMNEVAFVAQMLPDGVLLTAIAIVTLKTGALPRWLGWFAAVAAPLLLVNGMFLDAEFGPAFLLFLLWTLLASVVLTVRPSGVGSPAERGAPSPRRESVGRRIMGWSSALGVLVALSLPAGALASADVETIHFAGSFTQAAENPCTGAQGTASVTFKGVSHTNVTPTGSVHHTATVTGETVFTPNDSSKPSYTGRFTAWDAQNGALGATITSTATFHNTLFGSDGSRIRARGVFHVTQLADGTVTAALDRFALVCETG